MTQKIGNSSCTVWHVFFLAFSGKTIYSPIPFSVEVVVFFDEDNVVVRKPSLGELGVAVVKVLGLIHGQDLHDEAELVQGCYHVVIYPDNHSTNKLHEYASDGRGTDFVLG